MSKAKQKKKISQLKRKQMVEEVFKKGKKQRDIAKKFDEKIAQKQGSADRQSKYKQLKQRKKSDGNLNREHIAQLDKKLGSIRADKKLWDNKFIIYMHDRLVEALGDTRL